MGPRSWPPCSAPAPSCSQNLARCTGLVFEGHAVAQEAQCSGSACRDLHCKCGLCMRAGLQLWVPASIVQHNAMCCCAADSGQRLSSPASGCSRQGGSQLTPAEMKASRSCSMFPCHGRYRCQLASRRWSVAGSRGAYAWRAVSRMCCSCILDAIDTPVSPHAGRNCWLVNSAVARAAAVRCMTRLPTSCPWLCRVPLHSDSANSAGGE